MKVAELIDELKELDPEAELAIDVAGYVVRSQELDGRYSGFYEFEFTLEESATIDCIEEKKGKAHIGVWLK